MMGNYSRFEYDGLGRVIEQRVPFEQAGGVTHYAVTRFTYDRSGNVTQTSTLINRPGEAEEWAYVNNTFGHNQLMATDAGGVNTSYTYNLAGQVLTKNAGGAVTMFEYNNRGQLLSVRDALGQYERFTYDTNGLVLTKVDRNGTMFRNRYDHMGRLVREEAWENGALTSFRDYEYTLTGALRREYNGHAIQNYYDAQGRLFRQSETGGIVREYQYNAANNVTGRHVWTARDLNINWSEPSNRAVFINNTNVYDEAQRLSRVYEGPYLQASYTYDANGRVLVRQAGHVLTEYEYNLAGLVTLVTHSGRLTGQFMSSSAYRHYLDGNVGSVRETVDGVLRERTFTYDTARRLTTELEHDGPSTIVEMRTYGFDARGNRRSMSVLTHGRVLYVVRYEYDLNNRLLREVRTTSDPSVTTYTYDANGNQLTRFVSVTQPSSGADAFVLGLYTPGHAPRPPRANEVTEVSVYNAWNQLVRVVSEDMVAEYAYRSDGLRLSKTVNGIETRHVWDGAHIVLELNANGNVTSRIFRGLGRELVRSINTGTHPNVIFLHNSRGDVVHLVYTHSTQILRTYRYTAFGVELDPAEGDTNPWRFAGEYYDRETGTYYLRFRNMNPRTGRFLSADPFWGLHNMQDCAWSIVQSGNLFMYTMHNPVMFIDPTGLAVWLIHGTWVDWRDTEFTDEMKQKMLDLFGEQVFALLWTGENNVRARQDAANALVNDILTFVYNNPHEPIRLVGHSHGGNIAIMVANMLEPFGIAVDTLITIGTPVRPDFQLNHDVHVGQHIHLYNLNDRIQVYGGRFRHLGFGGRTFAGSENRRVSPVTGLLGRNRPIFNHENMHNDWRIWERYILPVLRVPL